MRAALPYGVADLIVKDHFTDYEKKRRVRVSFPCFPRLPSYPSYVILLAIVSPVATDSLCLSTSKGLSWSLGHEAFTTPFGWVHLSEAAACLPAPIP